MRDAFAHHVGISALPVASAAERGMTLKWRKDVRRSRVRLLLRGEITGATSLQPKPQNASDYCRRVSGLSRLGLRGPALGVLNQAWQRPPAKTRDTRTPADSELLWRHRTGWGCYMRGLPNASVTSPELTYVLCSFSNIRPRNNVKSRARISALWHRGADGTEYAAQARARQPW